VAASRASRARRLRAQITTKKGRRHCYKFLTVNKFYHTVWSNLLTGALMGMIETKILREPYEVDARLAELGLTRSGLLKVRDAAVGAAADVTPIHCANAAGTMAYHIGVYMLRDGHLGQVWKMARPSGVEVIRNDSVKVLVGFSNVHHACDDSDLPQPRSEKGAGAERVEHQAMLFDDLPRYAPSPEQDAWAMYYLMVDPDGRAELSRPIVRDGTYSAFIERLFLSNGDDLGGRTLVLDGDIADGFDPQVVRKAS
jgi:hypothetical protein